MRVDWDSRANADPFYYVDATRPSWTEEEFYEKGRRLVALIVDPVLHHLGFDAAEKRVLDLGCGAGRLTEGLAERFGEVWGVDVSERMLAVAETRCPAKATWVLGDGTSLACVEDRSVDYLISYEVLQHVPDKAVVHSYIGETARVLREGGAFQLHLRKGSDSLRQAAVRAMPRALRRTTGRVLEAAGIVRMDGDIDTWLGCKVPPGEAVEAARAAGLLAEVLPDDQHARRMGYWLVGRKPDNSTTLA